MRFTVPAVPLALRPCPVHPEGHHLPHWPTGVPGLTIVDCKPLPHDKPARFAIHHIESGYRIAACDDPEGLLYVAQVLGDALDCTADARSLGRALRDARPHLPPAVIEALTMKRKAA